MLDAERNMLDVRVRARLELTGEHTVPGDRLEGQLANEFPGRPRHHRHNVVPLLLQAAHDLDGLVGADSAAHAQSNHRHKNSLRD